MKPGTFATCQPSLALLSLVLLKHRRAQGRLAGGYIVVGVDKPLLYNNKVVHLGNSAGKPTEVRLGGRP